MFRFVVLAITLVAIAADADNKKKCFKLFHPGSMHCCKDEILMPKIDKEELSECFKMLPPPPPPAPHSCEHDICIGQKRGYASEDGTVDIDLWEKQMTKDFKDSPTLVDAIKDNCIKVDVSKLGPPDGCLVGKLKMCVHKAMVINCKEWDNSGRCNGLKDLVRECAKLEE